jgi:hypothetical protein
MQSNRKSSQRARILILSHSDGYCEIFAERAVEIHLQRVPAAFSIEGEAQAEDVMEALLPRRFRELWRADFLRATGSTRPLLPSVLRQSIGTKECLRLLNRLPEKMRTAAAVPDDAPAVDHDAAILRARRRAS